MASPFNSPLESAIRTLAILAAINPQSADLQRLLMFDYLLVHSADADGPPSLHPNTPLRNGELLVRRTLLQEGLMLLLSRELVERRTTASGIEYAAQESATPFLDSLSSSYVHDLRERGFWLEERFMPFSEEELSRYFKSHFDHWTTEFQNPETAGEPG
ncbi:MAG: ABC-three component system middle component 2 [Janthinobacterium lividum]